MERMRSPFTNRDLRKVWAQVGFPYDTSATDQIIRREKAAGRIVRHGTEWHPKEK